MGRSGSFKQFWGPLGTDGPLEESNPNGDPDGPRSGGLYRGRKPGFVERHGGQLVGEGRVDGSESVEASA